MTQYKAPLRDMRFLMNEVLDYPAHYASLPNGKDADPEMVDAILDGVRSLIAEQARGKGLAVEVDTEHVPLWLRGDPTRLRQALLNYAGNALKFTEHGRISLRARLLEAAGEEVERLWLLDVGEARPLIR